MPLSISTIGELNAFNQPTESLAVMLAHALNNKVIRAEMLTVSTEEDNNHVALTLELACQKPLQPKLIITERSTASFFGSKQRVL